MKLTVRHKLFINQLLAVGTRPCEISRKAKKEFGLEIKPNHLGYYRKKFTNLPEEEQIAYLPYGMKTSYGLQEVRINDDVQDMTILKQLEDQELDKSPGDRDDKLITELIIAKQRMKNRIAQELGQVRAFNKGGIANINILTQLNQKFEAIIQKGSQLDPDKMVEFIDDLDKRENDEDKSGN